MYAAGHRDGRDRLRPAWMVLLCAALHWCATISLLDAQPATLEVLDRLRTAHPEPEELSDALVAAARDAAAADRLDQAGALFAAALDEELRLDRWRELVELRLAYASVLAESSRLMRAREQLDAVEALLDGAPRHTASDSRVGLENRLHSVRGTVAYYRGDAHLAIEHWRRAATGYRESGDLRGLARSRYQEAQARIAQHDYAEAIVGLRAVLEVEERPRFREQVSISLGVCHYELNQFDRAAHQFERVLASAETRGDRVNQAWALGELGLVAWRQGDYDRAHRWNREALELSENIGNARNVIAWQVNDALVFASEGRFERASALLREARRRDREIGPPGSRRAVIERHLGRVLVQLGQTGAARNHLAEALAIARSIGDKREQWKAAHQLALADARIGDPASARATFEEALDVIEDVRATLRLESFKRDFLRDKFTVYSAAIDLIASVPGFDDRVEATFEIAERVRARAFLDTLSEARAGLHETLPGVFARREANLLERRAELVRSASEIDASGSVARLDDQLEANLLEAIAASPRFASMHAWQSVSLASLQRILYDEETVLSFFLGEEEAYLWLVDRERAEMVALGSAAQLAGLAAGAFSSFARPGSMPDLEELSRVLLEPLRAFEERRTAARGSWLTRDLRRRLMIVPSGSLHLVPFETLSLDGALLNERVDISYLPSASTLLQLRDHPVEAASPPSMLAIGDVDYSSLELGAGMEQGLDPLPGSGREALQVSRRFGRAALVLRKGAATETQFVQSVEGRSVVHLAAHSRVDASRPADSAVLLGADAQNDGHIGLREIVRLPLRADLVTLSACDSALGELVSGEGLVGLSRAFFYAGTDTVVASLWSVDDQAATELMVRFYRELARGESKAAALRRAKLQLRSQPGFEHPYYWAPFILIGRGEDGVGFPRRAVWPWLWPAALVIGMSLWWRRHRNATS